MRCPIPVKNRRRVLVRFPALHARVRHLQPRISADEGGARLHAAAGPPADRGLYAGRVAGPLHRREHPQGDRRRDWLGRRRPGQRHARPAPQIHDIAERAHAAGKVVMLGGPSASASPEMYPDIDYLHIGEMGDATDRLIACLDESVARPPAQVRFETKERLPLQDFPIPAYDLIPLEELSDAHVAVLERVPVSLRVLRHPQPLRPAAAAQDRRADHRRARCHAPAEGASAGGLFRRRQFHRQSQGRQGHAAASRRLAEAARLSHELRLRGDAQHRQAAGNPRAHARGLVPRASSSASRRPRPMRSRRCARTRTSPCR